MITSSYFFFYLFHPTENKERSQVRAAVAQVQLANVIGATVGFPLGLPMGLRIDQKTYVTQFDTKRNIPFYSAYMITDPQGQRLKTWTRSEVSDTWQADIPGVLFQFEIY